MPEEKQLKLLIVDDEEGIVDFIKKIYSRKGFITYGATDGITAVEIFQKERPQINLIDIHMPFSPIDGIETLKRIKAIDEDALCIMITRITEKDKFIEAMSLGAAGYILKPLDMEELDRAISEISGIKL